MKIRTRKGLEEARQKHIDDFDCEVWFDGITEELIRTGVGFNLPLDKRYHEKAIQWVHENTDLKARSEGKWSYFIIE